MRISANNAVDIQQVVKSYGSFTLGPVSFSLESGKIMGLLGENGAGKTTLLKILLNRRLQDSGNTTLCGFEIKDSMGFVGFVLDTFDFHENFSLAEINRYLKKVYHTWNPAAFFNLLSCFAIDKDKIINTMSRGTKSKAMLCIALAHNPKVLILDELTSGLDPLVRKEVLDILLNKARKDNMAVVFSTHLPNDVERIADFVCLLHKGKVLLNTSIEQIDNTYSKYNVKNLEELMLELIKVGEQ